MFCPASLTVADELSCCPTFRLARARSGIVGAVNAAAPTIDCDELWNQLSNNNPLQVDSANALHQIALNLNDPENLLDAGTTAARQIAAWLTTIADNQQPPAR
jgi:hypothetical protein